MGGLPYASPSLPISTRKFSGGLNSSSSPTSLSDTESSDLQNIDYVITGQSRKRQGYTPLNTTAFNSGATWNGLWFFEKSNGTKYLMGVCGNKFCDTTTLTQTATPFTDRTGALTLTAGNNNQISWATILDTVIATNGIDLPFQATGGTNATVMTVPATLTTAKFVETWNNYAFLANVAVGGTYFGSRIYWSNIDSITTWTASDFRDVAKADGQVITGLKALGSTLVIFKRHSIWIANFTGDSDIPFVFQKTRSTVGCVSGYSIQEVQNGLIFLADDGFYYFDGNNSFKMSDRISETLKTFNSNRLAQVVSIYSNIDNRYLASFTESGNATHTKQITWDSQNNAFSLYKGINANCFARIYSSGVEQLFFGDYSGYVYQMGSGLDDYPSNVQTLINSYFYTKWFDYDDMQSKKAVTQVSIYYQFSLATLTFAYSYDFEVPDQYTQTFSIAAGTALYGTAIYDTSLYAGQGGSVRACHLTGRGKVIRFKFANAALGETFSIDGFSAFINAETNVK